MRNKKIILAGGAGFIGQALAAWFGKDNETVILSRSVNYPEADSGYNIRYCRWDGKTVEPHWAREIDGADIVINLAGRSVNCRYTPQNRQEILDSRIDATTALGQAIQKAVVPPKLWINAASATIYRHAEDRPQDEYTGEFHDDFSVRVCKAWEKAFEAQRTPFTRKIGLRLAITLGKGGALIPYLRLAKLGLGGPQGNGRQLFSWIHTDDLCRCVEWFFDHPELEGIYNLSSPRPVSNAVFMEALRKAVGRSIGLPAPEWLLRIGAALIGTETELILKSRWVLPTKLQEAGFSWRYGRIEEAIEDLVVVGRDTIQRSRRND
jgi:uncharacterized protein (TIGR01777 family)